MTEKIYEDHPVFFVNSSEVLEFCGEICMPTGNIPKRIVINISNQQKEYVLSKRGNKI